MYNRLGFVMDVGPGTGGGKHTWSVFLFAQMKCLFLSQKFIFDLWRFVYLRARTSDRKGYPLECILLEHSLWFLILNLTFLKKFFSLMFIFERETHRTGAGKEQREGDTEFQVGSRLWAVSTEPDVGLELTNCEIMTWAEVGRSTDWATQLLPEFNILQAFKSSGNFTSFPT